MRVAEGADVAFVLQKLWVDIGARDIERIVQIVFEGEIQVKLNSFVLVVHVGAQVREPELEVCVSPRKGCARVRLNRERYCLGSEGRRRIEYWVYPKL